MINVESIYKSLRDLSTKGKGGYTDSTEFNRNSQRAELLLWNFYHSQYEAGIGRRVPEQMFPFLTSSNIALDAGTFLLPGDFGHFLNLEYNYAMNGEKCGDAPVITRKALRYLEKLELQQTLTSAVRGPSLVKNRLFYTFIPGRKIQLYPENLVGSAAIEYLRPPIFAVRAFTVDVSNDEQAYDAGNSVNYEWQPQEENNIIDLMLLFQGIITRDTPLIQWASTHQSIVQQIAGQ